MMRAIKAIFTLVLLTFASQAAEGLHFSTNRVEFLVHSGFNHLPATMTVVSNSVPYNGLLSVSSDRAWLKPVWNAAAAQVELTFASSNLVASQTATVKIESGQQASEAFVHAVVAPLNVLKFVDDPHRSRVYGVHAYGVGAGSILFIDPLTQELIGNLTVGRKPTDLAISAQTDELLVINSTDQSITVIDLGNLQIKETILLPEYVDWGPGATSGNIQVGAGKILYYTDGSWAPVLYVYDRSTKKVIQKTGIDGYGFGDFALTSDKQTLVAWAQYGWSAGNAGSYIARFSVAPNGALTHAENSTDTYPNFLRDPLDSPVLIPENDLEAFVKQKVVSVGRVQTTNQRFPSVVYAISPGGEIATTSDGIYDRSTGNKLYSLAGNPTAQVVTSDYARLVYFVPNAAEIRFLNLLETIGGEVLGRTLSPPDKAIVLPPSKLSWAPVPGTDHYEVYFGEDRNEVQNAVQGSPQFFGAVRSSEIPLSWAWVAGKTYYWRVDIVSSASTAKGEVREFTASNLNVEPSRVEGTIVQGFRSRVASVSVAGEAGTAWIAEGADSWISFVANNGTTPATVEIVVDASKLKVGITNSAVLIGPTRETLVSVPLRVRVDPLALTILKSDPDSAFVYGISENVLDPEARASLLEIDTENQVITRMVQVGSSVTDLAIHNGDQRIYVPNWRTGLLLAINKSTFQVERSFAFLPFGGTGYGQGDVYRVTPGTQGRLIVEEQDQWINMSIFDTVKGSNIVVSGTVREGGGGSDPTGRYYYHGENNSSGASIQKYNLTGDRFALLADVRGGASASYYGSRVVVVSEDGSRVFWNGSAFDADLNEQWVFGDVIYACTPDGRYAFGREKVWDIETRSAVYTMPVATIVSAYNPFTSKLVVQREGSVEFFEFQPFEPLPSPELRLFAKTFNTVTLRWSDSSLEQDFTLQMRKVGSIDWMELPAIGANITEYVVQNLQPATAFEFRLKANAANSSSPWSSMVQVKTLETPPSVPFLHDPTASPTWVRLLWGQVANATGLFVERSGAESGPWTKLAELSGVSTVFEDLTVRPGESYAYRVHATNGSAVATSRIVTIVVPMPRPPQAPTLTGLTLTSGLGVNVRWTPVEEATSYELERRSDDPLGWTRVATLGAGVRTFHDQQVEARHEYFYRISSINSVGRSEPSAPLAIFVERQTCILAEDFEAGADPAIWGTISGAQVIEGTNGFATGKALWFAKGEIRVATTDAVKIPAGAVLQFDFRFGNRLDGTNYWDPAEALEDVAVELSADGQTWVELASLKADNNTYSNWTAVKLTIPQWAVEVDLGTRIRWTQKRFSGAGRDTWAVDNFCLQGADPASPGAPPFIMVSSGTSRSVAIMWVGTANAQKYLIERSTAKERWLEIGVTGSDQTWFTDTKCTPATTYAYRVKAINAGGQSEYSAVAFGTTISQMIEWQVENFGSSSGDMTGRGSDGVPLLTRFAFNLGAEDVLRQLDPASPEAGLPVHVYHDGRLEVTFLRRRATLNPGVTYHVQFSNDLMDWAAAGWEISSTPLNDTWELVRYCDGVTTSQIRFCRVGVSLSP